MFFQELCQSKVEWDEELSRPSKSPFVWNMEKTVWIILG
jgi:hypothetical protein